MVNCHRLSVNDNKGSARALTRYPPELKGEQITKQKKI